MPRHSQLDGEQLPKAGHSFAKSTGSAPHLIGHANVNLAVEAAEAAQRGVDGVGAAQVVEGVPS